MRISLRRVAPAALAVALGFIVVGLLWWPVLDAVANGSRFGAVIKDYYLGDQLTYLSISSNVEGGGSAWVDPFTGTGPSIYPSGYYWLLGLVARLPGADVLWAWNVVGMAATALIVFSCALWGRWASGSAWGWCLGSLPILLGTFQWLTDDSWKVRYGEQSMLWPAFAVLFNPGAEAPALAIVLLSLLALAQWLRGRRTNPAWMALAGAGIGLTLDLHTYCAMFGATVAVLALLTWQLLDPKTSGRRDRSLAGCAVILGLVAASSGVIESSLGRLALVLAAAGAPLVLIPAWRRQVGLGVAVLTASGISAGSPVLIRIVTQALDPDSFFWFRQLVTQGHQRSLPVLPVLLQTLPVLALALGAGAWTSRRVGGGARRDRAWAALLTATLASSVLLTFNNAWGMRQEPYRFLPYGTLALTAVAGPWLLTPTNKLHGRLVRVAAAGLAVLTLPTLALFVRDTSALTLTISAGERSAYRQIAHALPPHGAVLLDVCLSPRIMKTLTGARVADVNVGLAHPERYDELQAVLGAQDRGELLDNRRLSAAGISAIVTSSLCNGPTAEQLRGRFGTPTATVLFENAASCGLPAGAQYSVYRVGDGPSVSTPFGPVDPINPFAVPLATLVGYPCAVATTY